MLYNHPANHFQNFHEAKNSFLEAGVFNIKMTRP
jgi:hypothetical protein